MSRPATETVYRRLRREDHPSSASLT
jgi:hypothetical protein